MLKPPDNLPEYAVKVRDLRARTGLTRKAFAEAMHHIPLNTVRDWELGVRVPPAYILAFLEDKVNSDYPADS